MFFNSLVAVGIVWSDHVTAAGDKKTGRRLKTCGPNYRSIKKP